MSFLTVDIALKDLRVSGNMRLALLAIGDCNGRFSDDESAIEQIMKWANIEQDQGERVLRRLLKRKVLAREEDGSIIHPEMHVAFERSMMSPPKAEPQWSPSPQKRTRIYERDDWTCVYCGATENLSLDHAIPRSKGGTHDDDNLVTCCKSCNSSKGTKTRDEYEAWIAEKARGVLA